MTFVFFLLSIFAPTEMPTVETTIDLGVVGSYQPIGRRNRTKPYQPPVKRYR